MYINSISESEYQVWRKGIKYQRQETDKSWYFPFQLSRLS